MNKEDFINHYDYQHLPFIGFQFNFIFVWVQVLVFCKYVKTKGNQKLRKYKISYTLF